jgi:hypothetical protein
MGVYGHQFYQAPVSKRVEYLNKELSSGEFESFEALAADIFIIVEDINDELQNQGYYFIANLNRLVFSAKEMNVYSAVQIGF